MLESSAFHEQLLIIACSGAAHHDVTAASAHSSDEHAQKLALDLLMWLLAVQTCPTPRSVLLLIAYAFVNVMCNCVSRAVFDTVNSRER